jgi:excisionase family DNA binding protein
MAIAERIRGDVQPSLLTDEEAALTKAGTRCLMAALDHSRAPAIAVVDETGAATSPVVHLPPKALRIIARVLISLGNQRPFVVVPKKHEMSTTDVANFLNVSRPFVIKEIEQGRLPFRRVGTHRRIEYEDAIAYKKAMLASQRQALDQLVADAQDLGLE